MSMDGRWQLIDAHNRVMTSARTRFGARRWLSRVQQGNPSAVAGWSVRRRPAGGERNG